MDQSALRAAVNGGGMKIFLIGLMSMLVLPVKAQLFREWFRQNATQKRYLIEQIAQLKVYLELTEKGYKIAREGLTTISDIKRGEFKLHRNRFDSLKIVKPQIVSYSRLRQITDMQDIVHQIYAQLPVQLSTCQALDAGLRRQIIRALDLLYDDGQSLITSMLTLIRDNNYAMTDDERLARIEKLYEQFKANYVFAQDLKEQTGHFCRLAEDEKQELDNRKLIHGLK